MNILACFCDIQTIPPLQKNGFSAYDSLKY